jgi:sugar/nucleoside kinase (ribokinase family)
VSSQLDYLVIGHVTQDLAANGELVIGGSVTFAARTACALGYRARVVTSARKDLPLQEVLPDAEIARIPSAATTTFENLNTSTGRMQTLHTLADKLTPDAVPTSWRASDVVHLAPVAQECDPSLIELFRDTFVGLTPQGWMRGWNSRGLIEAIDWESSSVLLPAAAAVVVSEEDTAGDQGLISDWAARTKVLVITHGSAGCTVHTKAGVEEIPGFPAAEVDSTGAGDIFAAVLFAQLQRGVPPARAARLANCLAAASVTRHGPESTPSAAEVASCTELCL